MTSEWQAKIEEMLENLHLRGKEAGYTIDTLRNEIDALKQEANLLKASIETQRVTISILASRSRNVGN